MYVSSYQVPTVAGDKQLLYCQLSLPVVVIQLYRQPSLLCHHSVIISLSLSVGAGDVKADFSISTVDSSSGPIWGITSSFLSIHSSAAYFLASKFATVEWWWGEVKKVARRQFHGRKYHVKAFVTCPSLLFVLPNLFCLYLFTEIQDDTS